MEERKIHYVDLCSIFTYKELGGLMWVDLQTKNLTLLNKWIWRFENEKGSLWRRTLVDNEKGDHRTLLLDLAKVNILSSGKILSKPLMLKEKEVR